jgi:hypothetical protein
MGVAILLSGCQSRSSIMGYSKRSAGSLASLFTNGGWIDESIM